MQRYREISGLAIVLDSAGGAPEQKARSPSTAAKDHAAPISPMTWGVEANVIERFAGAGIPKENVAFERDTYRFNFAGAPTGLVDAFQHYYGPTMNAFEAAEKNGRARDLRKELDTLFESQNTSPRKDATSIPATFLRVTVAVN